MSTIRDLSESLPAKHMLFLVDACYGGIAGQQFRSVPKITEQYVREITRERGRQIITAGDENQEAIEATQWGHSVFTYFVLEGLGKGLADLNGDGIIPTSELYQYLDTRVFAEAKLHNHTQRPQLAMLTAERGEFVFYKTPRQDATFPITSPVLTDKSSSGMGKQLEPRQERNEVARLNPSIEEGVKSSVVMDGTYTFHTVGQLTGFQARDPHPSPYFSPFMWVPATEEIEQQLIFHKNGRFEQLTYASMEYSEPGSAYSDPTKRTPRQLKERKEGSYQLKGKAGILIYSTGEKVRFYLPLIDEAFWPPETIVVKENTWRLNE
jgi:hypothetical protein